MYQVDTFVMEYMSLSLFRGSDLLLGLEWTRNVWRRFPLWHRTTATNPPSQRRYSSSDWLWIRTFNGTMQFEEQRGFSKLNRFERLALSLWQRLLAYVMVLMYYSERLGWAFKWQFFDQSLRNANTTHGCTHYWEAPKINIFRNKNTRCICSHHLNEIYFKGIF